IKKFDQLQVEGFLFAPRAIMAERPRMLAFQNAANSRDVSKFKARDAPRLELFLESLRRVINQWQV
ncbi:hypothetical protein NL529_33230, partial [Klebsiella pneumoniae]|nr:hypothetical protein [Klebsiella pneumoniae]